MKSLVLLLCAITPIATHAQNCVSPNTDAAHATVVVYRTKETAAGGRGKIFVDEKDVCTLKVGRYFILLLTPGVHALRSNKHGGVETDFKAGSTYYIKSVLFDQGYIGSITLQRASPDEARFDLHKLKPEDRETKPLPASE